MASAGCPKVRLYPVGLKLTKKVISGHGGGVGVEFGTAKDQWIWNFRNLHGKPLKNGCFLRFDPPLNGSIEKLHGDPLRPMVVNLWVW